METTLKDLANKLKEIFSEEFINEVAYKTGFLQRKSKLSPVKFLSLCTFLNEEMCTSTLAELSTRLDICEDLSITTEGLNQRFNDKSVSFMKYIFKEILLRQSNILSEGTMINTHFNQIRITDSSAFKLPSVFQGKYKGTGGNQTASGIKIQLEYNLNTGQFLNMDVFDGTYNDASYLSKIQSSIEPKDLCLKDLGYFKIDDLKVIEEKEAYYLSRLKTNIKVYVKNSHIETFKSGKPKKGKEYIQLDILDIISPLAQGETIEIKDVYIGNTQSLKTRLIITKLSEENKGKKLAYQEKVQKKKQMKFSKKAVKLASVNMYITNVEQFILPKEKVYETYSLRWQIEIMFKIFKSLFKVHMAKKVKIERFECSLYGKLIRLLLCYSIVFKMRETIYSKENKEVSEYKAFSIVKEYLKLLKEKLFMDSEKLHKLLCKILKVITKNGIKSKKRIN